MWKTVITFFCIITLTTLWSQSNPGRNSSNGTLPKASEFSFKGEPNTINPAELKPVDIMQLEPTARREHLAGENYGPHSYGNSRYGEPQNVTDQYFRGINRKNISSLIWGVVLGGIFSFVLLGISYLVKINRKERIRKQIEDILQLTRESIRQKKAVRATQLLRKAKDLDTKRSSELSEQIIHVESQLRNLKIEISQNVDCQIDNAKRHFADNPEIINNSEITDLLNDSQVPKEQKDRIKEEIKALENEYRKGVIPEQQIVCVNYSIVQPQKNGYYSFYTTPVMGTEVFPYRRRKARLRGFSEESFERRLRDSLKVATNYHVLGDVSILTSENSLPYEPDIAIIEVCYQYGIRIDIEIDEPYEGNEKTPIHYVGCGDDFRDQNLANLGWLVVRFSEKQITQESKNCIYYIQLLLSKIDPDFSITCPGTNPTPDKCWTELEARIMAIQRFRENLLNHEFGRRIIENNVSSTPLTEMEKMVAQRVRPISIPTKKQQNIDKTDTSFEQDKYISFEPSEHIYLYDGRIQLTAVSNIINQFFTPFDSLSLSERIAHRKGISQFEVLEDWDCKGLESREVGTFLHAQIEAFFSDKPISLNTHFSYNGQYVNVNENVSIDSEVSYFRNFLEDNRIAPFRTEWHIFDMDLRIAGTIDLLCRNGSHFDIYDWKRSRKASPNEAVYRKGINGLEHVPDISFYHYALQQNLYKYILEKNYHVNVENMYIVVLHPDYQNYQRFRIPDMAGEIFIIKNRIMSGH